MRKFALILSALYCLLAEADSLLPELKKEAVSVAGNEQAYNDESGQYNPPLHERFNDFAFPNEMNPADASPILRQSNRGIYFTVGTERGFVGASLSSSSGLVLADVSPLIVKYNEINIALLKAAKNRADYLALRLTDSHAEWSRKIKALKLDVTTSEHLTRESTWRWWSDNVRNNSHFKLFHMPPGEKAPIAFGDANYLHDDSLFQRIHNLAKQDKILAITLDLSDGPAVQRVVTSMKKRGLSLGVLDVSNVGDRQHKVLVDSLKKRFDPVSQPSSILLLTSAREGYRWKYEYDGALLYDARTGERFRDWNYHGFTFEYLATTPVRQAVDAANKFNPAKFVKIRTEFNGAVNTAWPLGKKSPCWVPLSKIAELPTKK